MKNEVLFVDDEKMMHQLVQRQLAEDNMFVTSYEHGKDMMNAINQKDPCLVILDVHLLGENGFDILKELKEKNPRTPVALVTGDDNYSQAQKAYKMGACAYITKPIDWARLRNIVQVHAFTA